VRGHGRSACHMNGRTRLAFILMALGVLTLLYQGFSFTARKRVVDIGPFQATREEQHNLPLPPILRAIALVGGIIVLASGRRPN